MFIIIVPAIQLISCKHLKQNETPTADYTTNFVKNTTLFQDIFHDNYTLEETSPITVTNLNQMLNPFKEANCLVHVTSFKSLDIPPEHNFPKILRQLKLALLTKCYKDNSNDSSSVTLDTLLWLLNKFEKPTKFQTFHNASNCLHSNFFKISISQHVDYLPSLCTLLSYETLPLRMKPWNCQVEVSLFPPVYSSKSRISDSLQAQTVYEAKLSQPGVWYYDTKFQKILKTFPSRTPTFTIMVTDSSLFHISEQINILSEITTSFFQTTSTAAAYPFGRNTGLLMNQLYLIFVSVTTFSHRNRFSGYTNETNLSIRHITLLLPNITGSFAKMWPKIPQETWTTEFTTIHKITSAASIEYLDWEARLAHDDFRFLTSLKRHIENCRKEQISSPRQILNLTIIERREACSIAHLLDSLLNVTSARPRSSQSRIEENGETKQHGVLFIEFQVSVRAKSSNYFPLKFRTSASTMRFISCGQGLISKLQFGELFSIFDQWIWIYLLLSTIFYLVMEFAAFRFSKINQRGSNEIFQFGSKFLSFIRIFLEQGNAIMEPQSQLQCLNRRTFLGSIVLAAIILSNAYKNTNVYNMIMPRVPIPMNTLEKLVSNGFKIFSRSRPSNLRSARRRGGPFGFINATKLHITQHQIYTEFDNYVYENVVNSEIFEMTRMITENLTENEKSSVNILLNHSRILSDTLSRLQGAKKFGKRETFLEQHHNFRVMEDQKVAQILGNCENVAVLLPHTKYLEHVISLSTMSLTGKSYQGKESWLVSDFGISLSGFVTTNILVRNSRLGQGGIWQWWENVLSEIKPGSYRTSSNDFVSSPTMAGNILIIFTVWLIGLGVALVKFTCELMGTPSVCKCQKHSIRCTILQLRLNKN